MCKRLFVLSTFFVVLGLIGPNAVLGDVIEVRIATENDDAEESIGGARLGQIRPSSDLEMPYEFVGKFSPQIIGLRYQVAVPKGATISEAWVRFQVDELKGGSLPVNLIIEGELNPNPGEFVHSVPLPSGWTPTFDISTRPRTAAQVQWSVPNWENVGDQGPAQTTSNIASIIQEIVNQDGWASGNSLVLIISDDPDNPSEGVRGAEAGVGADSALLRVEFQTPETMLADLAMFIEDEVDAGRIDAELENSLLVKIGAALLALERGNPNDAKVAMNDLKALINQVEAQIDKKIAPELAAEIIQRANVIIAELGEREN